MCSGRGSLRGGGAASERAAHLDGEGTAHDSRRAVAGLRCVLLEHPPLLKPQPQEGRPGAGGAGRKSALSSSDCYFGDMPSRDLSDALQRVTISMASLDDRAIKCTVQSNCAS